MFQTDFQNSAVSAIIGAAVGALSALAVNAFRDWFRLKRIHKNLSLEPQRKNGSRTTARVFNDCHFSLNSAYAYITIDHEESDVLEPPNGFHAYVRPAHSLKVHEDRLCWCISGNPAKVDIYPGERQALDVVNIDPKREWVEFPSEDGWGSEGKEGKTSRVFLKWKKYSATIKIVSKDSKAKEFEVWIDPDNNKTPLSLR